MRLHLSVLVLLHFYVNIGEAGTSAIRFKREAFEVQSPQGVLLEVRIHKYYRTQVKRLPVVFLFGGFENAENVLNLFRVDREVILVSFNYPFSAPRRFYFPLSLKYLPELKSAIHGTLDGIQKVAERVRERSDVDLEKMSIVGVSFGAPFAILAATENPLFKGLVVIHGFADTRRTLLHRMRMEWDDSLGIFSGPVLGAVSFLAKWYFSIPSVEVAARNLRSSQDVLLIHPKTDQFIPRSIRDSMVAAIRSSKASSVTETETGESHIMPGRFDMIRELLSEVERWMVFKVSLL